MIPYLDDLAMARGGPTNTPQPTSTYANTSFWTSSDEKAIALRWLVGIVFVWIVLSFMVDLGETADLAVAFALVITGSVVFAYSPGVFASLGISTTPPKSQGG